MILKNCLKIAMEELKICKGVFVFYLLIFVCLISVGTSMLDVSFYLPDRIATSIQNMGLDWITVDIRNIKQWELITSKYDVDCLNIEVSEFQNNTLGLQQNNEELYSGGVLLDGYTKNDTLTKNIEENLLYKEGKKSALFTNHQNCEVYICQSIAEENNLKINQKLNLIGRSGEKLGELYVIGIYMDSEDLNDYYINQNTYELYKKAYENCIMQVTLKNRIFKDIFSLVAWLQKNQIKSDYNKDMIGAIQMFYILFIIFDFIILIALSGNLFHLLEIYILRRITFYAINSALGMTQRDILRIIYILSELVINAGVIISSFVSSIILRAVNEVASELFMFSSNISVPVVALVVNWCLLQICIFVVIKRFRKRLNKNEIVEMLRYE